MSLEQITSKLVSFCTVSDQNSTREIADWISNWLEEGGFAVRQFSYATNGISKVNLVAIKGGNEPFLALSGHMDTVPAEEWTPATPGPFVLTKIGKHYYGRGVADMKLFLAVAMMAGQQVFSHELARPFALYFTSDEEVGCVGIKKLFQQGVPVPTYTVIGEPTGMVPVHMHKGYMYLRIRIDAKDRGPGHSSNPDTRKNVLKVGVPEVLQMLKHMDEHLRQICNPRFKVPFATLNPGVISMDPGAAKNIIASNCTIDLDVRPLPGQSPNWILGLLKRALDLAIRPIHGIKAVIGYRRSPSLPMKTPDTSPIVRMAEELSGYPATTVAYNTEGGVFNAHGSQSVVWGPANIAQAHTSDEHIHEKWLQQDTVDSYVTFIRRMCGKE